MRNRAAFGWALAAAIAVFASGVAWSQEATPTPPADPSPEQRQTMAELHRNMADCLASTRPIAECRAEMRAGCQQKLGQQGCPMMGAMGAGMGPGMGGGMMPGRGMMPGGPGGPAPPGD